MKNILLTLLAAVLVLSCRENGQPQPFSVIPMPNDVTLAEGSFNVAGALVSVDENLDEASAKAVKAFSETLETVTGKPMNGKRGGVIRFGLNPNMGTEEYFLQVKPDGVNVEASAFGGFFYAIQTLKQMLPAEVYGNQKANAAWLLPCVTILDAPRFDYRGIHLDPCRHFWTVEETKRYIDIAAAYKLNRLHWHLTEDQGWRMEIKKYPKLTEVGAWRNGTCIGKDFDSNDGIRYGGFYTQDEMREIVAYAAERNITVIPEVDLPGHMVAALAAYPELGCTGGPYEVWTRWGVSEDVLCVGKEETFTFLEDVLTEVMDIFPSEYIHIGGDECPKDRWRNCPLCQARIKQLGLKAHDNFSAEEERDLPHPEVPERTRPQDHRLGRNPGGLPRPRCHRHVLERYRRRHPGRGSGLRRGDVAERIHVYRLLPEPGARQGAPVHRRIRPGGEGLFLRALRGHDPGNGRPHPRRPGEPLDRICHLARIP